MKRSPWSMFALSLGALVLALCSLTHTTLAQKPTKNRTVATKDEYTIVNPCTGENLLVTDAWQVIITEHVDKSGCDRFTYHANNMGSTAVDQGGQKYRMTWAQNDHVTADDYCDGCTYNYRATQNVQYVGQGRRSNFRVKYRTHLVINYCTAEVSVIRENFTLTCDNEPLPKSANRVASEPADFALEQNYPNPFNPSTTIEFNLPEKTDARLSVCDALGREVAVLHSGMTEAGTYRATFDAAGLTSGVYLCRLTAGANTQTMKMNLLR
jgi:hypothetical protein